MNQINDSTDGWLDNGDTHGGTHDLASAVPRHQLVITGNSGDVVNSGGWGASLGTVISDGITYEVYTQGLNAQLLIAQEITKNVA